MKLNTSLINVILGISFVCHSLLNGAAGHENKFVFVNELPEEIQYLVISASGTGSGFHAYIPSNGSVSRSLYPNVTSYDIAFIVHLQGSDKKEYYFERVILDPQLDPKPKIFIRKRGDEVSLLVGRDYLANRTK